METQIKPRDVLPADAFTLPARYYTDPSLFAREIDRIWSRMWIAAARAPELPEPGDYLLRAIAGDSFLVVRGADGVVRAFWNVCRHRGTRLCTESEGRLPGRIRCPYHAWTYELDGRLAVAPHMDDVPHFRQADYPLAALACDVWDGHVFVRLAPEGPPLEAHIAGLAAKFRPWDMGRLRRAQRIVYDVRANWKLILQNYSECLHCPTIHPALNRLSHYLSGENEPLQPTYMGGRMDLRPGVETMSTDGVRRRACLPGVPPEDRRRVYYYAIFPNFLLTLHPDYMMTHTLWPHAVDRTEVVCEWHVAPEELARPGFDASDIVSFWDLTNRQDWHVCELAQSGLASRGYRPGPYSNREDLLYAFDRFIAGLVEDQAGRD